MPTAILLSNFTSYYENLVITVNIGSLGTLISSLASLITLKEYIKHKKKILNYIVKFTLINLLFLTTILIYMFITN